MSLGSGIHEFMSAGLSVGDRVSPLTLPQDTQLPAIVYRVVSDQPSTTHSTPQDAPTYTTATHHFVRVQFDCYGATYDEAEALCDELDLYASGFKGIWDDVEVDAVYPDVRIDDWDEGPGIWRVIRDYIIGYRQVAVS